MGLINGKYFRVVNDNGVLLEFRSYDLDQSRVELVEWTPARLGVHMSKATSCGVSSSSSVGLVLLGQGLINYSEYMRRRMVCSDFCAESSDMGSVLGSSEFV
jgi:hypothetical protein